MTEKERLQEQIRVNENCIKQHQEVIDKAKAQLEALNIIRVPDGIVCECESDFGIGIIKDGQVLSWCYKHKRYTVGCATDDASLPCKLTPCEWKDLKDGDVFFRSNFKIPDFNDLVCYAIKDGGCFWYFMENGEVRQSGGNFPGYWKVEVL